MVTQSDEEEKHCREQDESVENVPITVKPENRWLVLTSTGSLLATPGQAFLTNPALWSHKFITRLTEKMNFMAHAVRLAKFPPIDGCLQFWAGTCWKSTQWKKWQIHQHSTTEKKPNIQQFFFCLLLMPLAVCFPALLCSRFIFFLRLRRLCKYDASWAERSFCTCLREPCTSCLLGQSWNKTERIISFVKCSLKFHNLLKADCIYLLTRPQKI